MPNIGIPGLIIVLAVALLILGPTKLPQLGRAIGTTLSEFRKSARDVVQEVAEPVRETADELRETKEMRG